MKICTKCQIEKSLSDFGLRKRKLKSGIKEYYSIYCKTCINQTAKNFRKLHPYQTSESIKLSKQKWEENNKEARKQYQKNYYLLHKEDFQKRANNQQYKENKRKYHQQRRQDPIFRIKENISNAIYKALVKGKTSKAGNSILQFLGYSIQDLKSHLESLFTDNFNWDNYGVVWHIDHIIPHSNFSYLSMTDPSFTQCWALANLRPLAAAQNMRDGSTRVRHLKKNI